jgi:phosphate:Na+ symporter
LVLLTEGLKGMAGSGLRGLLTRTVRGPISGVACGAFVTALVQSSSATTMMTIGLVSAGLLTFHQSVGVVFGASVGTTATSWIVAVLGLKLSLSTFAMPMIFVGAMLRLLGGTRIAAGGMALAGFGLLFIGIGTLATGMGGFAERFSPEDMPPATLGGRALLALIGIAMTILTQSSSVSVAATVAALHAGAINLEQAAALVIGQSIGTAVTSAIASIGASTHARRTALAHILFNVVTGVVGFVMLPLWIRVIRWMATEEDGLDAPIALAILHTGFTLFGLVLLLPVIVPFSKVVTHIIPQRGPQLTRHLDRSLMQLGDLAIDAARRTAMETAWVVTGTVSAMLKGDTRGAEETLARAEEALHETGRFLGELPAQARAGNGKSQELATLHAVDHLQRLVGACREDAVIRRTISDSALAPQRGSLASAIDAVRSGLALEPATEKSPEKASALVRVIQQVSTGIAHTRREQRTVILERTAGGVIDPTDALERIEAIRWLDRIAYHVWRVTHHLLGEASGPGNSEAFDDPPEAGHAPSARRDDQPSTS